MKSTNLKATCSELASLWQTDQAAAVARLAEVVNLAQEIGAGNATAGPTPGSYGYVDVKVEKAQGHITLVYSVPLRRFSMPDDMAIEIGKQILAAAGIRRIRFERGD